jgi:hypothetical protein
LTAQEKEAKLKELEELRIKKRQERQDIMDREKRRMTDGKAVSKLRQELNDQELVKMAEERLREKQETADAKNVSLKTLRLTNVPVRWNEKRRRIKAPLHHPNLPSPCLLPPQFLKEITTKQNCKFVYRTERRWCKHSRLRSHCPPFAFMYR